jgi:hypothetical protein
MDHFCKFLAFSGTFLFLVFSLLFFFFLPRSRKKKKEKKERGLSSGPLDGPCFFHGPDRPDRPWGFYERPFPGRAERPRASAGFVGEGRRVRQRLPVPGLRVEVCDA